MTNPLIFAIMLIPIGIALFCKFALQFKISWVEMVVQLFSGTAMLSLIWWGGNAMSGMDTEILNGSVTGKHAWQFSCPTNTSNPCHNGYTCHIRTVCTGSGRDRSCHTESDTCYVYPWEKNWYVDTNLPNKSVEISRIDDQGRLEPNRYSSAIVGDPASQPHSYKNWVRAASSTLYRDDLAKETANQSLLVDYPTKIIDYYRIDRIITPNSVLKNELAWNNEMSKILAKLGPTKQMNMVVVIVEGAQKDYPFGLRSYWKGFKKNDAILVIGTTKGVVSWAEVMSWSKAPIFDFKMRSMLLDYQGKTINDIDPIELFSKAYTVSNENFVRRSMSDFEYLKGDIPPPSWLIWLSTIVAVIFGIGTSILFQRIDILNLNLNNRRNWR